MICSVESCTYPSSVRGYCSTHYARWKRTGDVQADVPIRRHVQQPALCTTGCGKPSAARGLCVVHYQRWKTSGEAGEAALRRRPSSPDDTEKPCTSCGEMKPLDDYHRDKRNRDGRQTTCKACYHVYQTNIRRKRVYGITSADYDRMAAEQDGRCLVCGERPTARILVVDHCHRTGKVRGLLCDRCNRLLGVADDNVELLRKAIAFLT